MDKPAGAWPSLLHEHAACATCFRPTELDGSGISIRNVPSLYISWPTLYSVFIMKSDKFIFLTPNELEAQALIVQNTNAERW